MEGAGTEGVAFRDVTKVCATFFVWGNGVVVMVMIEEVGVWNPRDVEEVRLRQTGAVSSRLAARLGPRGCSTNPQEVFQVREGEEGPCYRHPR